MFVQLCHPGRQNVSIFSTGWQFNESMARIFPPYWNLYFKDGVAEEIHTDATVLAIGVRSNNALEKEML